MFEQSVDAISKITEIWHHFFKAEPKIIFEFGARYGEDTILFAETFPNSDIFTFECNPNTTLECKENLKNYSNVTFTEKAISDSDGTISFFKIDKEKTITTWEDGNQGASSLFEATGKYPIEQYVQEEVKVESITLYSFMEQKKIAYIDILWMDIQGAELMALRGLKQKLSNVKLIHLEVEFLEIYKNQPLFKDIKSYLQKNGFIFLGFSSIHLYSGDAIFIEKKHLQHRSKKQIVRMFNLKNRKEITFIKRVINKIKRFFLFKN